MQDKYQVPMRMGAGKASCWLSTLLSPVVVGPFLLAKASLECLECRAMVKNANVLQQGSFKYESFKRLSIRETSALTSRQVLEAMLLASLRKIFSARH
jgi:hypothetical protein